MQTQQAHSVRLDSHNPSRKDIGAQSARAVVPLLISLTDPRSVVDLGCGPGNWLAAFRERGITNLLGVDQNDYGADLRIPRDCFRVADLSTPLQTERTFDLVICIEVAEHLPPAAAATLVRSMTALGSVVVFSAAIPFQGGRNHRNEQWPGYWRDLFAQYDFVPIDCIRPRIWENNDVAWWYTQNMLLYVRRDHLAANPRLLSEADHPPAFPLTLVHPALYMKHVTANRAAAPSGLRDRVLSTLRRIGRSLRVRGVNT